MTTATITIKKGFLSYTATPYMQHTALFEPKLFNATLENLGELE